MDTHAPTFQGDPGWKQPKGKYNEELVTWQRNVQTWVENLEQNVRKSERKIEELEFSQMFSPLAKVVMGILVSIIIGLGTWNLKQTHDLTIKVERLEAKSEVKQQHATGVTSPPKRQQVRNPFGQD